MFLRMGAFKPAGILTDALRSEWKQTCRRIAEKKVQDAEKATVDRVVTTWLELRSFLEGKGRPAPPEVVDLDQFLQHTTAPARALQALKWMNKNAQQDMDLSNWQVPSKPRVTGKPGQAPVVEPPLIKALEERIVEIFRTAEACRPRRVSKVSVLEIQLRSTVRPPCIRTVTVGTTESHVTPA